MRTRLFFSGRFTIPCLQVLLRSAMYFIIVKKKKKTVCETTQVNWISKILGTILLAPTARIPTIFDRYFI